jgi:hypothetical protein
MKLRPPNPRLQRTRSAPLRSPLSRKPFGAVLMDRLLVLALCATSLYRPGTVVGPVANTGPPEPPSWLTRPFPDPNSVDPPEILRNEGARCPIHGECFVQVDTLISYGLPGGHLSSPALAPLLESAGGSWVSSPSIWPTAWWSVVFFTSLGTGIATALGILRLRTRPLREGV